MPTRENGAEYCGAVTAFDSEEVHLSMHDGSRARIKVDELERGRVAITHDIDDALD